MDTTGKRKPDNWKSRELKLNAEWFLLLVLAFFEHVLDGRLVNHEIWFAAVPVHFDAVAIVPLNDAANFLAVLQHNHHRGSRLHLLLIVEVLGVSLLRRSKF